jgi:uncharacterized protein YggU (UPF0235/DUF167 family)
MKGAVRLPVKMHPGSSKRGIEVREEAVHLYTTAKPQQGKANADALDILADYFRIPRRSVSLFRGHRSKQKIFRIEGSPDELLSNLDPSTSEAVHKHISEV